MDKVLEIIDKGLLGIFVGETTHDTSAGSRNQPRVRHFSEVAFRRNAQKTGVDRLYPGIQNLKRGVAHLAAAGLFLFFADAFVLFNRITT